MLKKIIEQKLESIQEREKLMWCSDPYDTTMLFVLISQIKLLLEILEEDNKERV